VDQQPKTGFLYDRLRLSCVSKLKDHPIRPYTGFSLRSEDDKRQAFEEALLYQYNTLTCSSWFYYSFYRPTLGNHCHYRMVICSGRVRRILAGTFTHTSSLDR
jgi:hypothetical protein